MDRDATRRIGVVLSTLGKFHTFDLARQMLKRSALTAIFAAYPWFKLTREDLPRQLVYTFPWLHAPYMGAQHQLASEAVKMEWEWWDRYWFDRYTALRMPECDVFCGLSSHSLRAGRKAQSRGARFVCDRGSSHIRFQDQILREEYQRVGMPYRGIDPRVIDQEEAEYAVADAITVPSTFALESFCRCGVDEKKLHLVPYGADLTRFYPAGQPAEGAFDILFVGAVSVQKGFFDLLKAYDDVQHRRKTLNIVGSVSVELVERVQRLVSDRSDIRAFGHVPQAKLAHIMSRAHVMVLPSIQEGLALVQAQAMACGCPVIGTTNSGAENLFTHGTEGFIVPIRSPATITEHLQRMADDPLLRHEMGAAALRKVEQMGGWDQYGERMYQLFRQLTQH